MSEEMEQGLETELLTLVDEEGKEHEFEMADAAEFEDASYVALIPVFEEAAELLEDSGELIILKVVTSEGEDFLEAIEDEDEFNRVGAFFMERLADQFEFEDE